jgi:hypothetical protein
MRAVLICSGYNNFFLQLCCPIFDPVLLWHYFTRLDNLSWEKVHVSPLGFLHLCCLWAFIYILKFFLFLWIVVSLFSLKAEQKDALNSIVLLAYLQFLHLQSDGFLTTWSNSFVGPWDSSQGEHNPGNKLVITCITCLPLTFFSIFLMFGLNIFHIF